MLGREDDLRHADRLAGFVTDRDLALGVRTELGRIAFLALTRSSQHRQNLVAVVDRGRHQFGRLAAGIAEHDALVARALVFRLGRINALRNIGRLRMQQNFDRRLFPVEPLLLVADVPNCHACDMGNEIVRDRCRTTRLAGNHDPVGGGQGLGRHADIQGIEPCSRSFAEEQVHNLVRDAIADLVRMALGDRFTGKQVGLA